MTSVSRNHQIEQGRRIPSVEDEVARANDELWRLERTITLLRSAAPRDAFERSFVADLEDDLHRARIRRGTLDTAINIHLPGLEG